MSTNLPPGFRRTDGEAPLDIGRLPKPPAWYADALCAQIDTDGFFPDKGGTTREAKKICGMCPVEARCLQYALDNHERHGIWGGKSERERRALEKAAS